MDRIGRFLLFVLLATIFFLLLVITTDGAAGTFDSPISPLPTPVAIPDRPPQLGRLRYPLAGRESVVAPQPTPGWLPPEGWRR